MFELDVSDILPASPFTNSLCSNMLARRLLRIGRYLRTFNMKAGDIQVTSVSIPEVSFPADESNVESKYPEVHYRRSLLDSVRELGILICSLQHVSF